MTSLKSRRLNYIEYENNVSGYTLIELGVVVVLLAIVSSFFISKFDLGNSWGNDSSIREFANKIEFLLQDASSRKVTYEIEFFNDASGYRVWQIAKKLPNQNVTIDTLKNLRSKKSQQDAEEKNAQKALKNINEEYAIEEEFNQLPLDLQLYSQIFDDPTDASKRIPPLEYPSLLNGVVFPPGIKALNITNSHGTNSINQKNSFIISQSSTETAFAIELNVNNEIIKLIVKPFERRVFTEYANNAK